jgi:hypothetical protein
MASKGPPAEGSVDEPAWANRSAWTAIVLLLIPYAVAFSFAPCQRISRAEDALEDIQRIQRELDARIPSADPKAGVDDVVDVDLDPIVRDMVVDVYGEEKTRTPKRARDAERYHELALAAAWEWRGAYRRIAAEDKAAAAAQRPVPATSIRERAWERARERARESLGWEWMLVLSIQAFNVFLLPGLGVLSFLRARREIREAHTQVKDGNATEGFSSFARAIQHRRNRHLLQTKTRIYFWRRYALGALLTLGTTYMFAPRGQLASQLGDYTVSRPVPGGSSHPFFADHFIDAPIMVTGFVGYLLYVFVASLGRSFTRDLNDRFTLSLLSRGLVVGLLGLVLSAVADGSDGARALVFIVGVFPQRGIEWLSKKAAITPEGLPGTTSSFDALPSIDDDKATVLREVGINGVHDLARCDLSRLLEDVGIDPNLLARAADRALLVDTFGLEAAKKLEAVPIYTATELVLFCSVPPEALDRKRSGLKASEKRPQQLHPRDLDRHSAEEVTRRKGVVAEKLGAVDISVQLAALEDDDNVQFILHQRMAYAHR